jgi:hypothetical protein
LALARFADVSDTEMIVRMAEKGHCIEHSDRNYLGLEEKGFRAMNSPYTKLPEV